MKDFNQRDVATGTAVMSRAGSLRMAASASAAALTLLLSACSDGGVSAEPVATGKADPTLMAQELDLQSETSDMTTLVEEKALRQGQRTLAPTRVAAPPVAPQAPFISGRIVAAALAVDLNQVAADLKTAYLGGDPAADAINVTSILANDQFFAGSNGIIRNNQTPYGCCATGYPGHSMGALYSFVTGGLTLSEKMNVWTAATPRDTPKPTVMVRQEGYLPIQADDKVLLNTSHANWIGPAPYHVQLQVASDTDPEAFRLCWHVVAPSVRRLSCGIYSRDSAAFKGIHVIDDSAGVGPRTFRMVDPH